MCKLMSTAEMPTKLDSKGNPKKNFIAWFPKPNNEGENTRVRLLWFLAQNKNNRNTPYFTQMVHDHWGETTLADGKVSKIVDDTIVCPSTKYSTYDIDKWIKNDRTGKNELNCPICRKEKEAMAVWKNSGWKDKMAMKRHFALQAKFRAIIPVYIINDPNNPKNNNHMKVMILTNKEDFELFDQVVKAEKAKAYLAGQNGQPYEIFNGKDGIDLYLHCETVEETKKNGFVQRVRKMTGIAFDDPSNKYDIPDICKDKIDMFDMDEQFFVSNTSSELEDFYARHYSKDDVVIPKENVNIFAKMKANTQEMKKENTVNINNPNMAVTRDTSLDVDPDDLPMDEPEEEPQPIAQKSPCDDEEPNEDLTAEIMADLDDI